MANKLYVGNLNFQATADDIRALFAAHGEVQNVDLVTDRYTGRSRGFAFVEMVTEEAATKAREALSGAPFQERNLTVDWARPEGGGGGPRGDRGGRGERRPFRR